MPLMEALGASVSKPVATGAKMIGGALGGAGATGVEAKAKEYANQIINAVMARRSLPAAQMEGSNASSTLRNLGLATAGAGAAGLGGLGYALSGHNKEKA